jgi:hypothetical protein
VLAVVVGIDPVQGAAHLPPDEFLCGQGPCLRNMRGFLNRCLRSSQRKASSGFSTTGLRSCMSTMPPSQSSVTITKPNSASCSAPGLKFVRPAIKIGSFVLRHFYTMTRLMEGFNAGPSPIISPKNPFGDIRRSKNGDGGLIHGHYGLQIIKILWSYKAN